MSSRVTGGTLGRWERVVARMAPSGQKLSLDEVGQKIEKGRRNQYWHAHPSRARLPHPSASPIMPVASASAPHLLLARRTTLSFGASSAA